MKIYRAEGLPKSKEVEEEHNYKWAIFMYLHVQLQILRGVHVVTDNLFADYFTL